MNVFRNPFAETHPNFSFESSDAVTTRSRVCLEVSKAWDYRQLRFTSRYFEKLEPPSRMPKTLEIAPKVFHQSSRVALWNGATLRATLRSSPSRIHAAQLQRKRESEHHRVTSVNHCQLVAHSNIFYPLNIDPSSSQSFMYTKLAYTEFVFSWLHD